MEQNITADRIANAIMQDTRFKGTHVLVEGVKDLKVYTKFFNLCEAKLTPTAGKYKLREAYGILSSRGFIRKIGIRDADFLRIKGNVKFSDCYQDDIFVTDGHDSEIMMILNNSLEDLLMVAVDRNTQLEFENNANCTVRSLVIGMAYKLGCLRLANKKENLGLSFKPATPKGNRIKFKKFICENSLSLNIDQMVHIVWEYSKNRDKEVSSKNSILDALDRVVSQNHNCEDIINGHDVAEIICIVATAGLKSKSEIFQHPDRVEESLALSFDRSKFKQTGLFSKINGWQINNNIVNLLNV